MLQCNDCSRPIDPEFGPRLKIGLRRTVTDRNGNEIIVEIKCEDCNGGVSELPAVGASAA